MLLLLRASRPARVELQAALGALPKRLAERLAAGEAKQQSCLGGEAALGVGGRA
jgi:hypothetical protein